MWHSASNEPFVQRGSRKLQNSPVAVKHLHRCTALSLSSLFFLSFSFLSHSRPPLRCPCTAADTAAPLQITAIFNSPYLLRVMRRERLRNEKPELRTSGAWNDRKIITDKKEKTPTSKWSRINVEKKLKGLGEIWKRGDTWKQAGGRAFKSCNERTGIGPGWLTRELLPAIVCLKRW